MCESQSASRIIYRNLLILSFTILLQTQFGCNVISPTNTSDNSTSASKTTTNNTTTQTTANTAKAGSDAPEVCRNAYYPVGANLERTYHITFAKNSFPAQDYTEKYVDFKGDNFVAKTDFKDVNTTINWRCLPEGLLATQYGNSVDVENGAGAKIDTLKSDGVSFPVETRWNVGEKWTTKYDIKETLKNPNGQQTGEGNGTVNQSSEIIGAEEITVPAGKFQTMKVKTKTRLDLTVKVSGISVPTKTAVDTTTWFAKNVGIVKSEANLSGIATATTELLTKK